MEESMFAFDTVGQMYIDYKLTKVVPIPELNCVLKELEHIPTGAHIIHIENDDPENLFCLSFRTLPSTSNGVAHILEHTVLCGSNKYPVKDPFFSMNRRSLNTFMNAITGSDFTCYPASSMVKKDFYNLLEVYIDAVFHPNLNELSFMQEGHRLEFADPSNPDSELVFKGIVFNEMKGSMVSATSRLVEIMNSALFPDVPYGYVSGGDPKVIPQLTYEELKEFHSRYYHPSRCLFFFYGNFPLQAHLDFLTKYAFQGFFKKDPLPAIPFQPRFDKPVKMQSTYPASAQKVEEDNCIISFGWLTCQILNLEEWLALSVLEIVLLDTDASPLKMALLKSGLCKQVSVYVDGEINEIPFLIILKGCKAQNADPLEKLIRSTIEKIVEEGIPAEKINNAIHQLEFYRSEITGDQAPFGLSLFMRAALLRQHGGRTEDGLRIHSIFDAFQKKIVEDPSYLPSLLQRYILENTHYVRLVMVPDAQLSAKEGEEEKEVLKEIKKNLTPEQADTIRKKVIALEAFQKAQEEEDTNVLPKIHLEDVPSEVNDYPLTREKHGNLDVFAHTCFTNNIVYADLVFDLPFISEEELPYVRLFSVLFAQMGCGDRNYIDNLEYIQAHTGGIETSLSFNIQATDNHQFHPSFTIKGRSLYRKAPYLFQLLYDMVTSLDLTDVVRIKEVIVKHYVNLQSSLNQSGLKYALNLAASGLNVPSKIANDWFGIQYFQTIRDLVQDLDNNMQRLLILLERMKEQLLCVGHPHLVLACDQVFYNQIIENQFWGLQDLTTQILPAWKAHYALKPVESQAREIMSPVAFTAKVFSTVPYVHPDSPALNIAAFIFDNVTLHTRIREQGGAYGGGAVSNALAGNFYFYAYRDPHIESTLEAFDEAIHEIAAGNFDPDDLEEAKFEMIQSLDAPVSPGSRADLAYGRWREGKTFKMRQKFKDKIIAMTSEEVIEAVKKHIIPHYNQGATVVFAGKEILEKEAPSLPILPI